MTIYFKSGKELDVPQEDVQTILLDYAKQAIKYQVLLKDEKVVLVINMDEIDYIE